MPALSLSKLLQAPAMRWLIRLTISVLLLVYIFTQIDLPTFIESIRSIHTGFLGFAVVLFVPGQLLAAYRWYYAIQLVTVRVPFLPVLRSHITGQVATLFLPGQISGDVVRTLTLTRDPVQLGLTTLASILDKVTVLFGVAFTLIIGLWNSGPIKQIAVLWILGWILLVTAFLATFTISTIRSRKIHQFVVRITPKIPSSLAKFLQSISDPNLPRFSLQSVAVNLFLAFAWQSLNILGSLCFMAALNIDLKLADFAAIQSAIALLQIIPISIGGLGVREGAFAILLGMYSVTSSQAIAFSLTGFVVMACLFVVAWLILQVTGDTHGNH